MDLWWMFAKPLLTSQCCTRHPRYMRVYHELAEWIGKLRQNTVHSFSSSRFPNAVGHIPDAALDILWRASSTTRLWRALVLLAHDAVPAMKTKKAWDYFVCIRQPIVAKADARQGRMYASGSACCGALSRCTKSTHHCHKACDSTTIKKNERTIQGRYFRAWIFRWWPSLFLDSVCIYVNTQYFFRQNRSLNSSSARVTLMNFKTPYKTQNFTWIPNPGLKGRTFPQLKDFPQKKRFYFCLHEKLHYSSRKIVTQTKLYIRNPHVEQVSKGANHVTQSISTRQ